ncbi:hypothetical protein [Streptomyces paradoxus]|uniref:hypothetical protein n=1 Tax=Streptomyces paradoxus TaxID=66375 RepID=UPI0037D53CA4
MPRMHRRCGGADRGRRMAGFTEGVTDALCLVRAGVFAAVCVVVMALDHALMFDDALPWWAVGAAFAATASGAWWLTRRERRAPVVVGATVVAQGLLHLLFSLIHWLVRQPAAVGAPTVERASGLQGGVFFPSGVVVDHPVLLSRALGRLSDAPLLSAVTPGPVTWMFAVHLLAAVACGVWLWRGEAAAHRIGRVLAAALFAPLRRVCRALFLTTARREPPPCRVAVDGAENPRPTPSSLRHAVVRRGPPTGLSPAHRLSPGPLLAVRL